MYPRRVDAPAALVEALADRYRLDRRLGAGGMATVYLAHDRKHGREVAIKALRPHLAETLGRERFLREIQLAARLNHPNILPLYDSGEANGCLYFVMPVIAGQTLRDRLSSGSPLSVDEAVRIAIEVANASTTRTATTSLTATSNQKTFYCTKATPSLTSVSARRSWLPRRRPE
jgi:serine/threonine protein kinase